MTEYTCVIKRQREFGYRKLVILKVAIDEDQVKKELTNDFFEVEKVFYTDHIEFEI